MGLGIGGSSPSASFLTTSLAFSGSSFQRVFAVKVVDMGHVLVDASSAAEAKRLVAKKLRRGLKDIEKVSRAFPTKKVSDVDSEKI